jgi:hypothetical protein
MMRIIGQGYDGDLNLTSVTVEDEDGREYYLEVVRQGRWTFPWTSPECSVCNKTQKWTSKFCPNCGAKMNR